MRTILRKLARLPIRFGSAKSRAVNVRHPASDHQSHNARQRDPSGNHPGRRQLEGHQVSRINQGGANSHYRSATNGFDVAQPDWWDRVLCPVIAAQRDRRAENAAEQNHWHLSAQADEWVRVAQVKEQANKGGGRTGDRTAYEISKVMQRTTR